MNAYYSARYKILLCLVQMKINFNLINYKAEQKRKTVLHRSTKWAFLTVTLTPLTCLLVLSDRSFLSQIKVQRLFGSIGPKISRTHKILWWPTSKSSDSTLQCQPQHSKPLSFLFTSFGANLICLAMCCLRTSCTV